MNKKLKSTIILFIVSILFLNNIVIASTPIACALLSTDMDGIDSEQIATINNAKSVYEQLGYSTNAITDPGDLVIFSNALSSDVQLYFCRGNQNLIEFASGGLYIGDSTYTTDDNKDFYGTGMIDWGGKKLVTLAASNTAGTGFIDSTSIASEISKEGAQMTVGWYSELNPYSSPDWLDNYHNSLGQGKTPVQAISEANGYTYFNNNCKNAVVFSISGVSGLSTMSTNSENTKLAEANLLDSVETDSITINEAIEIIEKDNEEYSIDDYKVEYSEGNYIYNPETNEKEKIASYIDYNLKIGDFITNSGYTMIVNSNGKVIKINDNTIEIPDNITTLSEIDNLSNYQISNEERIIYLNRAKATISNKNDIIDENISFYYDLKENKKQAYVEIKIKSKTLGTETKDFYFDI